MNIIIRQLRLMERIDQLIRLQATGTPKELAYRVGISRTKLYAVLNTMKALNAPVEYNHKRRSFVYAKPVNFSVGFHFKEHNAKRINA